MIPASPVRASRALLGTDPRNPADLCGQSLPTIRRMEASDGVIHGNVDSLRKLVPALERAGIALIAGDVVSTGGGRGGRLTGVAP